MKNLPMKILVTGKNGQVGYELARRLAPLGEMLATDRQQLDMSRPETIRAFLELHKPDAIVNAAAYTAVDKAEEEEALATAVNGHSVGELAEWARQSKALLVHYSTDYVFDGKSSEPYLESHATKPINAYGRSKLVGEVALAEIDPHYLCLRTSWVYATRGQNFFLTMLRLAKEREELAIVGDQFGVPNFAPSLAGATAKLVGLAQDRIKEERCKSGIYHLSGQGSCSWFEFANQIFALARPTMTLALERTKAISMEQHPTPAERPKYSVLSNLALQEDWGLQLPTWQAMLGEAIKTLQS